MTVSDAALQAAIDLVEVPITLLDLDGRIRHVNQANARLLGRTAQELRGEPVSTILPAEMREQTGVLLASLLEHGKLDGIFSNVRPDGTTVLVAVSATLVRSADGTPRRAIATVRDLGPELAQLAKLNASALGLLTAPGDDLLVTIVRVARELLGARYAALGVVEDGRLVRFIPEGMSDAEIAGIEHWPEGRGLLGAMITERRTMRLDEIGADPRSSGFPPGHPPMHSVLGTPIRADDEVYGHLYFTDKLEATEFSIIDEHLAELFASHAAIAIRDQRQREVLEASVRLLAESQEIGGVGSGEWDLTTDRMRWSDEALRLFGVDAERLARIADFLALVAPDDRSIVETGLRATLDFGRPFMLRHLIVRPDGAVRVFSSHAELMRDASGTPSRMVGTIADITEQVATERERARLVEGLRRSERNLAEAQRISHIGSWEWDLATDTAQRSEELHRIYGVEPGAIPGTTEAFLAFVHPDDRARVQVYERAAVAGSGRYGLEYRAVRPDGTIRLVHDEAEVIRDEHGAPVRMVGTVQDITERVAAEETLIASELRYAAIFEGTAEAILIAEVATKRLRWVNSAACALLGYSRDELLELTVHDIHPPADLPTVLDQFQALADGRMTVARSLPCQRRDGTVLLADIRASAAVVDGVACNVGFFTNVTERVAAEAERDRLVAVIEQTSESIVLTDARGTIEYVNPAFERVTGYAREEVIGQNPRILKSGLQTDAFYRDLWTTLAAGQAWRGLFVNRRKDGSLFEEEEIISPIRDAAGRVTHYAATKRDVTLERATGEALGRETRGRAEISAALGRLRQGETVEATAELVCAEIASLPGLDSTSLVAFEADGTARVLAVTPAGGGATLPAASARRLVKRAARGPWIEERLTSRRSRGLARGPGTETHAFVPVTTAGRVEGLLIAGTADPDGRALLAERLVTLSDLAAIAATVLGPGLEARRRTSAVATAIRQTIAERAFRPVFQPIVELVSGDVVGYEALTRFADGTPPDARFAAAEAAGLGLELEAATLGAALAAAGPLPVGSWLELNASPSFVLAGEPLAGLLGALRRPLVLEVTEHALVADYAALRGAIGRLGPDVRLAVDDAGAGYASLRHILELAPDFVKLDIGLIRGIDADPARQALVAGIGHFAAATGCTLIAEGVETAAEVSMVTSLGVPLAQGYWFAHPGPVKEVVALGTCLPIPIQ